MVGNVSNSSLEHAESSLRTMACFFASISIDISNGTFDSILFSTTVTLFNCSTTIDDASSNDSPSMITVLSMNMLFFSASDSMSSPFSSPLSDSCPSLVMKFASAGPPAMISAAWVDVN